MTRVPGRIENDNAIGANQVDAKTSGPSGYEEKYHIGVGVKLVDKFFTLHPTGASV